MTILFISDLHLTPERPEILLMFNEFMRGPARDADQLYILGDLFEYWIGIDAIDLLQIRPMLDEISGVVKSGTEVFFIAGNRDFLVGNDFAEFTGTRLLTDGTIIELDSRPVLLMHGDSLCTNDVEHQAFRQMVLNPEWQARFLSRPITERIELARQARMLSTESTNAKPMAIMDVNNESVVNAMNEHGVDLLIHGHTHRPDIHTVNINGADGSRIVLGDWYEQMSALEFSHGEIVLTAGGTDRRLKIAD
jgi:UDP-2,3-diacylglucosamine hydrolase